MRRSLGSTRVILHEGYARERARRLEARLRGLVHAERVAIPDLGLSPPVGRIGYDGGPAARLPPGRARRAARARVRHAVAARCAATVPPAWACARVDLLLDTRSEATVWLDGRAVQGLHSGRAQLRGEATLVERAAGGEALAVEIEIACQDTFGYGDPDQDGGARGPYRSISPFVLDRCELGRFDPDTWAMLWDLVVLRELEAESVLDPGSAGRLLARLDLVCERWESGDRGGAGRAPRRAPRGARGRLAARAVGDRPRPPRHRLAVADRGDVAQAAADLLDSGSPDRRVPRVPVRGFCRPSTTRGSPSVIRRCGRRSASACAAASGSRSAAHGSSRTATCHPASRWPDSSSTASGFSSGRSGAAAPSCGSPMRSASPVSCRS